MQLKNNLESSCVNSSFTGAVALALCHAMVTMATQIPSVLTPLRSEVVSHFSKVVVSSDDDSQESKDLVVGYNFERQLFFESSDALKMDFTSSFHRLAWQH